MKLLPLFLLSFFSAILSAQTVGQYELRKRGSTGFTSYGVTLSNGQVIGQTAGVPAAITPFDGAFASLTGKPTTLSGYGITNALATTNNLSDLTSATTARSNLGLVIGTNVQAYNAVLAALASLSNASGILSNNGSGTLSWRSTSSTGSASTSANVVPLYAASGVLNAGQFAANSAGLTNPSVVVSPTEVSFNQASFFGTLTAASLTANRSWVLPDAPGTFINTGNLSSITAVGTITSGTWNGSIIAPAYLGTGSSITTKFLRGDGTWQTVDSGLTIGSTAITGGTSGRLLTSGPSVGELTLGNGVSTWLGTPTIANLNSAVSDADVATTGVNTLTGTQTINGLIDCKHGLLLGDGSGSGANGPYIGLATGVTWRILRRDSAGGTTIMEWNTNDANVAFPGIVGIGRVYSQRDTFIGRDSAANLEFGLDHATAPTNQVLKAHDVTTGTGAKLTLAGGKGSVAGGAVALATSATNGSPVEHLSISASGAITLGSTGTAIASIKRSSVTLVAGTATVSDTATTANSVVLMSVITPGGTVGTLDYDVSAGSSYTINSSSATDTSTLNITVIHYP